MALSTIIPLFAFILLLRDLVQFYFSPRFLEIDPIKITRFSLAGITLPYDEGIEAKAQVISLKSKDPSYGQFMLGGTSEKTVKLAHKESLRGQCAFPLRLAIMNSLDRKQRTLEMSTSDKVGVALSLAGSLDRTLVSEVARMESSVCRHVLLLIKLVLRYSKALILFVWTTLCLLFVSSIINIQDKVLSDLYKVIIALGIYSVWSLSSIVLVRMPVRWIEILLPVTERSRNLTIFRDPDLKEFENRVTLMFLLASIISIVLAIIAARFPGWIS